MAPTVTRRYRSARSTCRRVPGIPTCAGSTGLRLRRVVPTGVIPACAGSTKTTRLLTILTWGHPRMRGEHDGIHMILQSDVGSSPHARGARAGNAARKPCGGVIPACAGSTFEGRARRSAGRGHPRMRGEHENLWGQIISGAGSSPHARGALEGDPVSVLRQGVIPACAGSTLSFDCLFYWVGGHPRMRGEHRQQLREGRGS